MPKTMSAARMHVVHQPLSIDTIEVPEPRPTDVLVKVGACGIVPNLGNILNHFAEWWPHLYLPPLPAVFGLDVAGVVVAKGAQVRGIELGARVYVNPARYCGGCVECRVGNTTHCDSYTYNGYFGFGKGSLDLFADYPHGGLCEYMTAPQYSLVTLPDNLPFETAARFGYLGTGYRALKRAEAGPRDVVLVNGGTGTLGLGTVLFALAMGVRKVLAIGRDQGLLDQVKAIDPHRIEAFSTHSDQSVTDWARSVTDGEGVSVVIDTLGPGAEIPSLLDAFGALRRGGQQVNIGAVMGEVPINLNNLMIDDQRITGSNWFTTADGQEMADMAGSGAVDLSVFEHEVFRLEEINEALALFKNRNGGFSNYVVIP